MSNPIAAGCSEMVSDDIAMDGASITIDSDIHHRDWGPVLRNPALTPPPESLVETSKKAARSESARLVADSNRNPVTRDLIIEEQQAEIEKLRSALEAMTMKQAEQAETMTMEQAETERLRAALEGMTAVANDASKIPIEELMQMSASELGCFIFSNCELSVLDKVFKKADKYGDLDPPTVYRETGKTMRTWQRLGTRQQRQMIDAYKTKSPCETKTPSVGPENNHSSHSSARATRRTLTRKVTPTPNHEPVNHKRTRATASTTPLESMAAFTPSSDSAFRKRRKHEEIATTTAMPFENGLPQQQLLPSFDARPPAGAQVPTPVKAPRLPDCQGLVLDGLIKRARTDHDLLEQGYRLLIAEAIHNFATVVSRDLPWHLNVERYFGVLDNKKDENKSEIVL
jgi:hypothetical protein